MSIIDQDLYQFSTYFQPINLSFHQYLLSTDEPILFHTGNIQQAIALVPQLKAVLNGKILKYIYITNWNSLIIHLKCIFGRAYWSWKPGVRSSLAVT